MNLDELMEHEAFSDENVEKCVNALVSMLKEWSDRYYNHGDSPVDDPIFDTAKNRLKMLAPDHPYLATVGAEVRADGMIKHNIPMGSLDNVNNEQELLDWWEKTQPGEVIVQYKYDGLSLGMEYEQGRMIRGLTRGDGIYGEDQTNNILHCYNGPSGSLELNNAELIKQGIGVINNLNDPFDGSVRGEGIVHRSDFTDKNFPGESNPRNSAVGAIRKSNSERAKHVRIVCYDLVSDKKFTTEVEKLEYMEELGLPVAEYHLCTTSEEVINCYNNIINRRDELDFLIDGMVIKVNEIARQEELGSHNQRPKWGRAFKFPCMTGITTITRIDLTVGHTGNIIPTAEYETLEIEGRNFVHALLDNFDTIEKHNLAIGDRVEIEITGDIIPKVRRVVEKGPDAGHYPRPTSCPVCDGEVVIDGAYTKCASDTCSAKSIGKINNWVKKTGIKYFGASRQEACFQADLITEPAHLYTSNVKALGEIIGDGNATAVRTEIENHRTLPLSTFMGSLGIKFLGRSNAKKLIAAGIDSLERFRTFDPEVEKEKIDGFGSNLVAIKAGIEACSGTIDNLLNAGVTIEAAATAPVVADDAKSFCFTGVRIGAHKEAFEARGWQEKSGVSKNLDYLVAKDPTSTSGKAKKARDLGVEIISLDEFVEMLNE
jgi:DNA ligase (NAD+)